MLDKMTYTNHLNQTIEFGSNGVFLNECDVRDYAWEYDSTNQRISNFRKGVVKKKANIVIVADTDAQGVYLKNRIFEILEQDILEEKKGRLQIGDYYYPCYIASSKKSDYLLHKNYVINEVEIISDNSNWFKETLFQLKSDQNDDNTDLKSYPYGFPYGYTNFVSSGNIMNGFFTASDFIMRFYGGVTNPAIAIAGHLYQLNVALNDREYAEINSRDKTITLFKKNGNTENIFWMADKSSYIFEKIPVGSSVIVWNGSFDVDITLLYERSEPEWT